MQETTRDPSGKLAEVKTSRESEIDRKFTKARAKNEMKSADSIDVLYYVGCTASYDINVKEVGINTINILDALGIKFGILGKEEKCCGSVLLRIGNREFERLSSFNIELFNSLNVKMLVTSCAGCYRTIANDYRKMGALNMEVLHTTQLIARLLRKNEIKFTEEVPCKVTFHDPCHMGRHSDVYDDPREVMAKIPGVEFVEMHRHREFSRCCGAGGGLKAGFGDIQNLMAQERIRDAEKTGAGKLVSNCPFCYQGLQIGINAIDSTVKMTDITELVARAMGIEATS